MNHILHVLPPSPTPEMGGAAGDRLLSPSSPLLFFRELMVSTQAESHGCPKRTLTCKAPL